jgi:PPOX class probable F420-dependent enzyme
VELDAALGFVRAHRNGVLVTARRDGRPQMSNIIYSVGDDGTVGISITADRAKYRNLLRDPAASLHVTQDDFWAYVVLDGTAELSSVAADPHDATVDALVELYRAMVGEHRDWAEYRAAMVSDRRVLVTLHPRHAYGMLPRRAG